MRFCIYTNKAQRVIKKLQVRGYRLRKLCCKKVRVLGGTKDKALIELYPKRPVKAKRCWAQFQS